MGYDLGIDVRGDVLTVLVLALAGVPRRVGWAMGGGAFLLTDVAAWIPGRHEVRSRLALLARLGIDAGRVGSGRRPRRRRGPDRDRPPARGGLAAPQLAPERGSCRASVAAARLVEGRESRPPSEPLESITDEADWLHADRFSAAPSAPGRAPRSRHTRPSAGRAGSWKVLIERFLEDGWRVVVVGGHARTCRCRACSSPTTGSATGPAP